jgi:hypothetical protein
MRERMEKHKQGMRPRGITRCAVFVNDTTPHASSGPPRTGHRFA